MDLREDFRIGNFGDNDLGARCLLEFDAALDQAAGDDVAGTGQDVDGDTCLLYTSDAADE